MSPRLHPEGDEGREVDEREQPQKRKETRSKRGGR